MIEQLTLANKRKEGKMDERKKYQTTIELNPKKANEGTTPISSSFSLFSCYFLSLSFLSLSLFSFFLFEMERRKKFFSSLPLVTCRTLIQRVSNFSKLDFPFVCSERFRKERMPVVWTKNLFLGSRKRERKRKKKKEKRSLFQKMFLSLKICAASQETTFSPSSLLFDLHLSLRCVATCRRLPLLFFLFPSFFFLLLKVSEERQLGLYE